MVKLSDLMRDLDRALSAGDLERAASVRRTIAEAEPDSPEGAEANYKLGLNALFRERDLAEAAKFLRAAGKAKDPVWSAPARVSLGLVLFSQKKHQQAAFELRRVAGKKSQDLVAAQAWGLIVMVHRDEKKGAEAERARGEQLKLLTKLTKSKDPVTASVSLYTLGMELKHDGERGPAKERLQAALASGHLPESESASAKTALQDL